MKKNDFNTPHIEEHEIDPLGALLLKQNSNLRKENKKLTKTAKALAKEAESTSIDIKDLHLDLLAHKAYYGQEDLGLANREYEILLYLARHVNEQVTFEDLATMLFGSYSDTDKQSIMVVISRLRKKMQIDVHLENMLENIRGVGYRLIG